MSETKRAGRPRDPELDDTILETVFDTITSRGYDQLRVDDVAASAGVSLSTIYRRWRTKGELAAAALEWGTDRAAPDAAATTVSGYLERVSTLLRLHPEFLPGIVVALRDEPDLAESVRSRLRQPDVDAIAADLAERAGRAATDPMIRLLADLGPAVMFTRALIENEAPTDQDIDTITELIELVVAAIQPDGDAST